MEEKMSKEELFNKYQEIVFKTNGGADDYVVALCRISNLIKEFAEAQDQQIADLEVKFEEIKNQTAIAELEKVKDFLIKNKHIALGDFDIVKREESKIEVCRLDIAIYEIDQQIKSLKGENKNEHNIIS